MPASRSVAAITSFLFIACCPGCGPEPPASFASNGGACAADDGCAGNSDGAGGSSYGGQAGGGGAGPVGCSQACSAGTFCSETGKCIADGACEVDGDCAEGAKCEVSAQACVPAEGCGGDAIPISAVPPNMMLVMDRTGSMAAIVPNSGGQSRWSVAVAAAQGIVTAFAGKMRFGLTMYPGACGDDDECVPAAVHLPTGSDTAAINQALAGSELCNNGNPATVIGATLMGLKGEASIQDPKRDNAILLVTDGQDNCGGGGPQAATALLQQSIPVPVHVVGFSGDVDKTELSGIAAAAGTSPYLQADDPQALTKALTKVAQGLLPCKFQLEQQPPAQKMYVFFDKNPAAVPQDANDGYAFDPSDNSVTFHGKACSEIKSGAVTQIDVVFGCPLPPIN